ncbi:MAG: hypothetical protein Q9181_006973 [Wetmoreana brouardii]
MASYLSSAHCKLESLYMSCNPVGNAGATALARGLSSNASLLWLSITSCGLEPTGVEALMNALASHPRLMTLNVGQNYATDDLDARYNWLDDQVLPSVKLLVAESKMLKMLDLGTTAMSLAALVDLAGVVSESESLAFFSAKSVYGKAE